MIVIHLDQDGKGTEYDNFLAKPFIPAPNEFHFFTKSDGTKAHRPIVLMAYAITLPDGRPALSHTTMTGREFHGMATAFMSVHPGAGDRDDPELLKGAKPITGKYRGVGYDAHVVERVYLLHVEGFDGVQLAGSEQELTGIVCLVVDKMLEGQMSIRFEHSNERPSLIGCLLLVAAIGFYIIATSWFLIFHGCGK